MTTATEAPTRTLRILPVPINEPHALAVPVRVRHEQPPSQGVLALTFSTLPPGLDTDPVFAPQPTASQDLPDPGSACRSLVQAVVEVLNGIRPASQLVRWLDADVYSAISRRSALAARMRRDAGPSRRPVVRGVRICEPADGVVEGSAVVIERNRVRAVAIRLEGMDGRWRATAVEVG